VIASHDWGPVRMPGVSVLAHRLERDGDLTRSLFWTEAVSATGIAGALGER
jgi:hypothetical protein